MSFLQNPDKSSQIRELTIIKPDDFHLHLRDGDSLPLLVSHASRQLKRAIIMPNLVPPVTKASHAMDYFKRIKSHVPKKYSHFKPLMTLYLTDNTSKQDIIDASNSGIIYALKLYPRGVTTNSDNGVTDIMKLGDILKCMAKYGLLLLIHGEVNDKNVDVFNREKVFVQNVLPKIIKMAPDLKIVLEHITTAFSVDFIYAQYYKHNNQNLRATITAHHLLSNRNSIFNHGINQHYYCLPIIKKNQTD